MAPARQATRYGRCWRTDASTTGDWREDSTGNRFYRLLGVELADIPRPWQAHHRTVTNVADTVTVELDSTASVPNWAPSWDRVHTGPVIGFAVDTDEDVDRAVEIVASAGHRVLQAPHDAFFGARSAIV